MARKQPVSVAGLNAESVLESLTDAIVIVDDGNSIVYVNRATSELLGWPASELVGRPLTTIVPERLRDAHLAGFERHLITRENRLIGKPAVRVPALRKDGTEVNIDLSLNAHVHDGREVFVASLRDSSNEIELERVAALNRALSAARDIAVRLAVSPNLGSLDQALPVVLEVVASTLQWNVAIGWTVDGSVLRPGPLWFGPQHAAAASEMGRAVRSFARGEGLPGRVWESGLPQVIDDTATDANFPRRREATRHGLSVGFAIPIWCFGEVVAVTEFFRSDALMLETPALAALGAIGQHVGVLLERSEAMQKVEASESRAAAIVEGSLDCILGIDDRGVITTFNPAAERVLGWKAAEVIGQPLAELIIPERFRAAHHASFTRHVATGSSSILGQRLELFALRSDGDELPVELTITKTRSNGRDAFTGFLRDISAQKQAELEVERSRQRLALIAETLQASLAPAELPPLEGMDISARFRPAGAGDELGGDFYDVFEYAKGQWCLVIGDVCGKGAEAAVLTALARYTLRAAALERRSPAQMLELLNQAILREQTERFASVCVIILEQVENGWAGATSAAGGHPLPLIRRRTGTVESLPVTGPLVGLFQEVDFPEVAFRLEAGDVIVLYTDGVTEAKIDGKFVDDDGLVRIVESATEQTADALAQIIYQTILDGCDGDLRDDVAILVASVTPAAPSASSPVTATGAP